MSATECDSPIFVVGYMHSGTTLLQAILGANSTVYTGSTETRYFERRNSLRRDCARLDDREVAAGYIDKLKSIITGEKSDSLQEADHSYLVSQATSHRDHDRTFGEVFSLLAREAGCRRWVEKTPTHVFHADQIIRAFPDARFVEIVRDCRDVLASKKTRRATVWTSERYTADQRQFKHWEKAFDPIWDTLSWRAAISAGCGAARRHKESWLTIRYEDLVANPSMEVERMCKFLAISFEDCMLDVPFGIPADPCSPKEDTRGVRNDSVGRYIRVLSRGEIAACQLLAAAGLNEHRYPLDPARISTRLQLPAFIAAAAVELPRRVWRRYRMGGLRFVFEVLTGYATRLRQILGGGIQNSSGRSEPRRSKNA